MLVYCRCIGQSGRSAGMCDMNVGDFGMVDAALLFRVLSTFQLTDELSCPMSRVFRGLAEGI